MLIFSPALALFWSRMYLANSGLERVEERLDKFKEAKIDLEAQCHLRLGATYP
jgi:hypothetical protein